MPLPAKIRRERRRYNQEQALKVNPPRNRRCDNCGDPYPMTTKNRRFCCTNCRIEFFKHGSAFGPLKSRLTDLVLKLTKQAVDRIERLELVIEYMLMGETESARAALARGRAIVAQERKKIRRPRG